MSDANKTIIAPTTFEDLDELVRLHELVFEVYIGVRLGKFYIRSMFEWYISENEKYSICLSAKSDHRIVGYVIGAPLGYSKNLSLRLLLPALYGAVKNPSLMFSSKTVSQIYTRLASMLNREPLANELPTPIISLVGLGVVPEARGKGVGKLLVNSFHELASQQNYQSIRLSVYKENNDAIRFYQGLGWKVYDHPGNSELLFCAYVLEKNSQDY
jgi:ribosomal protein S18 acetylase RimI-like enzyme